MGYMRHHTIIVTSPLADRIKEAHDRAQQVFDVEDPPGPERFERLVSPILQGMTNGYQSFFIAPDGSKEGWGTSDTGDDLREQFITWLREQAMTDWVLVQFGDDGGETKIVTSSQHDDPEDS